MKEFKCRICGWESFNSYDGYCICDNCGVMFEDPQKFTLKRELNITYLDNYDFEEWGVLDKGSLFASGVDLKAAIKEPITIYPYKDFDKYHNENKTFFAKIPFGIAIQPSHEDMDVKIYNRSGLSSKKGVSIRNQVGIVDYDYRGEVMGFFINLGDDQYTINPGEEVVQICVEQKLDVNFVKVNELEDTDRGSGGFGSTGKGVK